MWKDADPPEDGEGDQRTDQEDRSGGGIVLTIMGKPSRGKRFVALGGMVVLAVLGLGVWFGWDHLRFWWLFQPLGKKEQGYPEYRHRQTGIVMVRLPGGEFMMGSSRTHREGLLGMSFPARDDEELPLHRVELDPFLIAKYEVSQAEWVGGSGQNNSKFRGDKLPVDMVTWEEASDFCRKQGLQLPTEAQWEYACRANTQTLFAFGDSLGRNQANSDSQSTVAVDAFEPNGFGLYNMHGNTFEWCEDVWDPNFYSKAEATRRNPLCTAGSHFRVARGGSFIHSAGSCRSSSRSRGVINNRSYYVGFRPAFYPLP